MIHEDIVALIVTKCVALISDANGDRIFPNHVPPKLNNKPIKRPLIKYQKPDDKPVMHMSGRTETSEATFDFECQGNTYDEAQKLAALLKTAFDGCPKKIGGSYLKSAIVEDSSDQFIPNQSGQETGIHTNNISVKMSYQ